MSRLVKYANLRITGLGESVTDGEIVAAVARVYEFSADYVKTNGIRSGPRVL